METPNGKHFVCSGQDLIDCQGAAVDIGGYYRVDVEKTNKATKSTELRWFSSEGSALGGVFDRKSTCLKKWICRCMCL